MKKIICLIMTFVLLFGCTSVFGTSNSQNGEILTFTDVNGVTYTREVDGNIVTTTSIDDSGFTVTAVLDTNTMIMTSTVSGPQVVTQSFSSKMDSFLPTTRGVLTQTRDGDWSIYLETRATKNYYDLVVPGKTDYTTKGVSASGSAKEKQVISLANTFKRNIETYNNVVVQSIDEMLGISLIATRDVPTIYNAYGQAGRYEMSTSENYERVLNTIVLGLLGLVTFPFNWAASGVVLLNLQSNRGIYDSIKEVCNSL